MRIDQLPGLNTADNLYEVGLNGLVRAENVDLSRNGSVSRRAGRIQIYAGVIQAAWGDGQDFLFVEGNTLKLLNPDHSATVLAAGLNTPTALYGLRSTMGWLYWSTVHDCGVIVDGVNRAWGLPKPTTPLISGVAGNLPAGRYLVAVAYVDSRGVEGPLSDFALIEDVSGISIAAYAPLTEAEQLNVYITLPNGEVLYFAFTVNLGEVASYVGDASELSIPAEGLYRTTMPVGSQLVEFAGRLWTALDDTLVYSDPFSEMTDLRENFIPVGSRITNFGAVTDGLFVTTEHRTYFYAGRDPAEMSVVQKAPYGAIAGTIVQVDGRALGEGKDTLGLIWASFNGICAGISGGTMLNITERQVNKLSGAKGVAFFREINGQKHYIAAVQS